MKAFIERLLVRLRLKKPAPLPKPTLKAGWLMFYDLVEKLDTMPIYLEQIEGFEPSAAFKDFYVKTMFFSSAARDELKIQLNNIEELRVYHARLEQLKNSERSAADRG